MDVGDIRQEALERPGEATDNQGWVCVTVLQAKLTFPPFFLSCRELKCNSRSSRTEGELDNVPIVFPLRGSSGRNKREGGSGALLHSPFVMQEMHIAFLHNMPFAQFSFFLGRGKSIFSALKSFLVGFPGGERGDGLLFSQIAPHCC